MRLAKYTEIIGLQLVIVIGMTVGLSSLSLLIDIPINGIHFVLGIVSSVVFSYLVVQKIKSKSKVRDFVTINILFLTIVFLSLFVNGKIYDLSWDGQSYHQEAVINLQQGWNPIYDEDLDEEFKSNFWINHYAKGTWFFAASVYDLLGNIEFGKSSNLMLFIASCLLVYSILRYLKFNMLISVVMALFIAMNPIVINQVFSFYIDGQLASLIVILVVLFIRNYINKCIYIDIAIIFTLILMVNIKFTALGYAIIICFLPFTLRIYESIFTEKDYNIKSNILKLLKMRELKVISTGLFLGVFIVGASSYISNTIEHKHPFYPLSGEGKVDIMSYNTPVSLLDKSTVERFYISLFAESTNNRGEEAKIKFPLKITEDEMKYIGQVDTRIGGFGPLFGAILVLSIMSVLIWRQGFTSKGTNLAIFIILIFTLTIVINPEPWWARYIPQLWVIPFISIFVLMKNISSKSRKLFTSVVLVLVIINISVVQTSYFGNLIKNNDDLHLQLETLKEYSKENEIYITYASFRSNRTRLSHNNIEFVEQNKVTCENPFTLVSSTTKICIEDSVLYNEIKKEIKDYD